MTTQRHLSIALGLALLVGAAPAGVPADPPTFSDPLTIDNPYHPFVPGRVKRFLTRQGHTDEEVFHNYLLETRTFAWNGTTVECHVLEEFELEDGELAEISLNYFAQADDGTVYYFGEVVDDYEDGVVVSHEGSWLVGGPTLPTDPPGTATAADPAVFMPASPEVGDVFKPEDLFPLVDETAEVVKAGKTVAVPAGVFQGCIKVRETSQLEDGFELKWYAPGVGVVLEKEQSEILELVSIE